MDGVTGHLRALPVMARHARPWSLLAVALLATPGCGATGILGASDDDLPAPVAACVEVTRIQQAAGDPAGVTRWEAGGGTEDGLRATCESLTGADDAAADAFEAEWQRMQAFFDTVDESATTTTVASAAPPADEPTPAAPTANAGCDPNYSGCVPIAEDVDCIDAGDGPAYIRMGAIVTGQDIYDLDANGNGLACDPTERG
jgi:hypothetical protein